ncbi:MAG: hypothetical protein CMN56_14010 [Sneathiella sp.]|uniref:CAP domain-containing protein n=1 Tax=Sneathiella sp. TaxID=1964365 RepID=UPI000C415116|nr:CAP domain-containing protein [Sneathiella sp.]MAZ04243.1 hypothetical protein [Sneathiella sp.]
MSLITETTKGLNAERAKAGLPPLTPDDRLMQSAQQHSDFMDKAKTLTHQGENEPPFDQRIRNAGYVSSYEEENIAWTTGGAQEVVKLWMGDKPHRDNILNPKITNLGLGISPPENTGDASTARYWALDLAAPLG